MGKRRCKCKWQILFFVLFCRKLGRENLGFSPRLYAISHKQQNLSSRSGTGPTDFPQMMTQNSRRFKYFLLQLSRLVHSYQGSVNYIQRIPFPMTQINPTTQISFALTLSKLPTLATKKCTHGAVYFGTLSAPHSQGPCSFGLCSASESCRNLVGVDLRHPSDKLPILSLSVNPLPTDKEGLFTSFAFETSCICIFLCIIQIQHICDPFR